MLRSPPSTSLLLEDGANLRESNLRLAARAGVRDGDRIVDVGCGVGGLALDIAAALDSVSIDGLTTSQIEAAHARALVRHAGLDERVRIHVRAPRGLHLATSAFDVALVCEPIAHTEDVGLLLAETRRVLRPGGRLHVRASLPMLGDVTSLELAGVIDAAGFVDVEDATVQTEPRARVFSVGRQRARRARRAPTFILEMSARVPAGEPSGERLKAP